MQKDKIVVVDEVLKGLMRSRKLFKLSLSFKPRIVGYSNRQKPGFL